MKRGLLLLAVLLITVSVSGPTGEVQAAGGGVEIEFCESSFASEVRTDSDGTQMVCHCWFSTCYSMETGAQVSQTEDCLCNDIRV